ncbi:hypothetical protein K503DRAFT_862097, partial [Rhizopogon vinicolor AM-OR11-026]
MATSTLSRGPLKRASPFLLPLDGSPLAASGVAFEVLLIVLELLHSDPAAPERHPPTLRSTKANLRCSISRCASSPTYSILYQTMATSTL